MIMNRKPLYFGRSPLTKKVDGANEFIADAALFLGMAFSDLESEMSAEKVIRATLMAAIGFERMFKGLIYEVNPVYAYRKTDFKNTLLMLYGERMHPEMAERAKSSLFPNQDTITFKAALEIAVYISRTCHQFKAEFDRLRGWRDRIVHNPLPGFDIDASHTFLLRHLYRIVDSFVEEFELNISDFTQTNKDREFAEDSFSEYVASVHEKLKKHKEAWEATEHDEVGLKRAEEKTRKLLEGECTREVKHMTDECPACNNTAIVTLKTEYFDIPEEAIVEETEITAIPGEAHFEDYECFYCGLKLEYMAEVEILEIDKRISPWHEFDPQ